VEMRKDCLVVRKLHARAGYTVHLFDLVSETIGQRTLKL